MRYIASNNNEPFLRDFNEEGLSFSRALQFTCHSTKISVSQTCHVTKDLSTWTLTEHKHTNSITLFGCHVHSNLNRLPGIQGTLFFISVLSNRKQRKHTKSKKHDVKRDSSHKILIVMFYSPSCFTSNVCCCF